MATITRTTLPIVDAVQHRMEELSWSRRHVATALSTSPSTISNWMRGMVDPVFSRDLQHRLAIFLELSPYEVAELFEVDLSRERMGGYRDWLERVA